MIDNTTIRDFLQRVGPFFSSDDFRKLGFDKGMNDPAHEIGAFFRLLQDMGLVQQVGYVPSRIPSNHRRRILLFEKTSRASSQNGVLVLRGEEVKIQ